jgi:hypothetical protein
MKDSGRMRARVIWLKIFLHVKMILKDSLKMPKNPRNWSSSCSLSMISPPFFTKKRVIEEERCWH